MELVEPGSDPPEPIRITVGDWQPHGTTRAFHNATFEHRSQTFVYTYESIRFNDADPALLVAPADTAP